MCDCTRPSTTTLLNFSFFLPPFLQSLSLPPSLFLPLCPPVFLRVFDNGALWSVAGKRRRATCPRCTHVTHDPRDCKRTLLLSSLFFFSSSPRVWPLTAMGLKGVEDVSVDIILPLAFLHVPAYKGERLVRGPDERGWTDKGDCVPLPPCPLYTLRKEERQRGGGRRCPIKLSALPWAKRQGEKGALEGRKKA